MPTTTTVLLRPDEAVDVSSIDRLKAVAPAEEASEETISEAVKKASPVRNMEKSKRAKSRIEIEDALRNDTLVHRLFNLIDPKMLAVDFTLFGRDHAGRAAVMAAAATAGVDGALSKGLDASFRDERYAADGKRSKLRIESYKRLFVSTLQKDSQVRPAVQALLQGGRKTKPTEKNIDDAIVRLILKARCASVDGWRSRSSGAQSNWKRRHIKERRFVPKDPRSYDTPTFPGITRTIRIHASTPVGLRIGDKYLSERRGDRSLPDTKPDFVVRSQGYAGGNLNDDRQAFVNSTYGRALAIAASLCADAAVGPERAAKCRFLKLALYSMLPENPDVEVLLPLDEDLRRWELTQGGNHPSVLMPAVSAFVSILTNCNALFVAKHLPKSHAALCGKDLSGISMPSAYLSVRSPEETIAAVKAAAKEGKDLDDRECAKVLSWSDSVRRTSDDSVGKIEPVIENLSFIDYVSKLMSPEELGKLGRKEYADAVLAKVRSALGLALVTFDPSEYPTIAFAAFAYDWGKEKGLWAVQSGQEGLPSRGDENWNVQWAAQSCMRSTSAATNAVAFYAHRTMCDFALVVDRTGKIHGRALLWKHGRSAKDGNPTIPTVSERLYITSKKAFDCFVDGFGSSGIIHFGSKNGKGNEARSALFPVFGLLGTYPTIRTGGAYYDTLATAIVDRKHSEDGHTVVRGHAATHSVWVDKYGFSTTGLPGNSTGDRDPFGSQELVVGTLVFRGVASRLAVAELFNKRTTATGKDKGCPYFLSPHSVKTAVEENPKARRRTVHIRLEGWPCFRTHELTKEELEAMLAADAADDTGYCLVTRNGSLSTDAMLCRRSHLSRLHSQATPAAGDQVVIHGTFGTEEGSMWNPETIRIDGKLWTSEDFRTKYDQVSTIFASGGNVLVSGKKEEKHGAMSPEEIKKRLAAMAAQVLGTEEE